VRGKGKLLPMRGVAEPDCPGGASNIVWRNFLLALDGGTDELQMVLLRVRCPQMALSMYSPESTRERRAFAFGNAPQCGRNDETRRALELGTLMDASNS